MSDLAGKLREAVEDMRATANRSWRRRVVLKEAEARRLWLLMNDAAGAHMNGKRIQQDLSEKIRLLTAELEAEREKARRHRIAFLSACEAIQHAESTTDSFCAECGRLNEPDGCCLQCPPF